MTDESNNGSDHLLDQATALLRESAGTELPPRHLVDQTLARLAAEEPARRSIDRSIDRWRFPVIKNRSWAAAAAIIIVSGIVLFSISQRGSTVAFGEVVQKVRAVSVVAFKMTGKVQIPPGLPQDVVAHITVGEPFKMREIIQPGNMTVILDLTAGKQMMLDPTRKSATFLDLGKNINLQAANMNVLDQFQKIDPKKFASIGQKLIDGKKVAGFRSENTNQTQTVWVDPDTQLPVQVEVKMSGGMMFHSEVVMTEFDWNPQIDESTFSLTAPAGYQSQAMSMDMSSLNEKDAIDCLRRLAEYNKGVFPDTLDMAGMIKAFTSHIESMPRPEPPDADAMQKQSFAEILPIVRGLGFLTVQTDAHYAGKGAKLNDANRPILWFKPKDAQRYHVINAELKVSEVDAEHLPTIASMPISMGAMMSTTMKTELPPPPPLLRVTSSPAAMPTTAKTLPPPPNVLTPSQK